MNHAFIDRYSRLDSPLHKRSPATKILGVSVCLIALLFVIPLLNPPQIWAGLLIYSAIMVLITLSSSVPFSFLLSRSALVLPFSVLIVFVNYVSGNFSFAQMIETTVKSLLSIFTLLLLTSTTPFHEILKQLSRWGTPRLFIIILSFMYRYFFLLMGEIEALERAVHMRHSSVSGWKRIRVYTNMIGMLLVRSYERAEHVYQAMQMRGFTGDFP
ncbi:MAG: energy-coupling factor transporter transmembrane protein EcfT [Candidatus Marinimicrobia bacterium]|nr:energy-coupling factor transporter transmembrane protein EcfT [Candidatus Neomarinimicrobiota bacterium]MCF7921107.1 energy-coupling factor transporter transmembrane protein EcfT [Candidatus Neomarinimicrobiota bacterium]